MSQKGRKSNVKDEEEDLTKDMEEPMPEPNIQEVNIPKSSKYWIVKKV